MRENDDLQRLQALHPVRVPHRFHAREVPTLRGRKSHLLNPLRVKLRVGTVVEVLRATGVEWMVSSSVVFM